MADFVRWPGGQSITGQTVTVQGTKFRVGLKDAGDLVLTDDSLSHDLDLVPVQTAGTTQVYDIFVTHRAIALKGRITAKIYATSDLTRPPAATFDVVFEMPHGKPGPAKDLIVRPMTKEIFGQDELLYNLGASAFVNTTTYRPLDVRQKLDFHMINAGIVRLQLFAAKLGQTERTFWLQLPATGTPASMMVVISHTLGQGANAGTYEALKFHDPFSKPFLEFMRDRFVLWRWGRQTAAGDPTEALLLPIRVGYGSGTLGPFVGQKGSGGAIVNMIAEAAVGKLFSAIDVCTFSSGIEDANIFTANCGLKVEMGVNQDPARGIPMRHCSTLKQYLSGYTTGGPRGVRVPAGRPLGQ